MKQSAPPLHQPAKPAPRTGEQTSTQRSTLQPPVASPADTTGGSIAPSTLQMLQRSHGNRAALGVLQARLKAGPANDRSVQEAPSIHRQKAAVDSANRTGLPDDLKAGVESLSGLSMDGVSVHYNSSKPAQLSALAYTQGTEIHVGPGQERHLPHEAWHVVQQAQGRVQPTMQLKGRVPINDDAGLEQEADRMGQRSATRTAAEANRSRCQRPDRFAGERVVQRQPKWKSQTTGKPTNEELNQAAAMFIANYNNVDLAERGLGELSDADRFTKMTAILKFEKEKIIEEFKALDALGWAAQVAKLGDPISAIGDRLEKAVEEYLPLSLNAAMPESTWKKRFATSLDATESLIGIGTALAELGAEALGGVGAQAASIGIDTVIVTAFAALKGATVESILLQGTIAATCAAIKTPIPIGGEIFGIIGGVQGIGDALRLVPRVKQIARGRHPGYLPTRERNTIDEKVVEWVDNRIVYVERLIAIMDREALKSSQKGVSLEEGLGEITKKSSKLVPLEEGVSVDVDHELLLKLVTIYEKLVDMKEALLNASYKTGMKAQRAKKKTKFARKFTSAVSKVIEKLDLKDEEYERT